MATLNAAVAMVLDGRFPAGGHTHSAGVEAAIAHGDIYDETTLARYLRGRLATSGFTDACFAAHTCRLDIFDAQHLLLIDAEYEARTLSPALRAASRQFGRQLLRAGRRCWTHEALDAVANIPGGAHQPVALGAVIAAAGGSPFEAALVSLHHVSAAVTTSAVRLLGLDPLALAAVQSQTADEIDRLASDAAQAATTGVADLPALGGSLTDILAEHHQRWDSRMFVA